MAKISSYDLDTALTGGEKLLASANSTLDTVNVLLSDAVYFSWKNIPKVANQSARLALTPSVGWFVYQLDNDHVYLYKSTGWAQVI